VPIVWRNNCIYATLGTQGAYQTVSYAEQVPSLFLFSTCFGRLCAHHQEKKTVFMRHLVLVILYGWLSGMHLAYLMSHKYSCNILRKICAPSSLYLKYYTGLHGQQNMKVRHACLYVRPSAWNSSAPTWRLFMKFNVWVFFEKKKTCRENNSFNKIWEK